MQFGLQPNVIEQIREVFVRHSEVETVILYGSRAKGNFRPGSGIDLTLKGSGLNVTLLNRIDGELDDLLLPWTFDLSIYARIETADLIEHIERAGIVFYERECVELAVASALRAGAAVMNVYQREFTIEYKDDRSPLTEADQAAHELIVEALSKTGLPVLSEESKAVAYEQRKSWSRFWLVDPLDGTKEFIKRNGEFTVNIALIDAGRPVLGVVYAPVLGVVYCGTLDVECGVSNAWKAIDCVDKSVDDVMNAATPLSTFHIPHSTTRVVASRSHCNEETQKFIEALEAKFGAIELVSIGSSLKLCLVAEGRADVYPRIAPTMEWDTAAAQAVVEASGGTVMQYGTNEPLSYNKENLLNPFFVVSGRDFQFAEGQ